MAQLYGQYVTDVHRDYSRIFFGLMWSKNCRRTVMRVADHLAKWTYIHVLQQFVIPYTAVGSDFALLFQ